jgi:REP element-mobilizing transposase RayT
MPRPPRGQLEDGIYHVTARGNGGLSIFLEDVDRLDFISLLHSAAVRFEWLLHVYCLMTTHYHLIVETTRTQLSGGMERLNGSYVRRFNHRHERRGHLFSGRFAAYLIRDDRHFEAACRYVLENPVRAGLCEAPGDWPWSAGAFDLAAPI